MKPETGRTALVNFFRGIISNIENIPDRELEKIGQSPVFTDLQLKQIILPIEREHYYCLNFALVTDKKESRDQIHFLLQMITAQAMGKTGEGYSDTEKRVRAYLGEHELAGA